MAIKDLMKLLPPPADPVRAGPAEAWGEARAALGVALPADWRAYALRYGTGHIWPLGLSIYNPLDASDRDMIADRLDLCRQLYELPEELHPASPGLFPLGLTDQRQTLFYFTQGKPNRWPIFICSAEIAWNWGYHPIPLTALLAKILQGEVIEPGAEPWFDPTDEALFKPTRPVENTLYELYARNGHKADFWAIRQDMGQVLYHVKKVAGKTHGPIRGRPPYYLQQSVSAARWGPTGAPLGGPCEDLADERHFPVFRRVARPPWARGKNGKK